MDAVTIAFCKAVGGGGSTPLQSKSCTPTESAQTILPDAGYALSEVDVGAIPSTYVGTGVPRMSAATITPGTSDQTIAADQYLTGAQTILGDADLVAGNIKKDVDIFGVVGTFEGGVNSAAAIIDRTISEYIDTDGITTIGSDAFAYCSSLTTASFPACTSIGYAAFLCCTSLATVSFPVCTSIGSNGFYKCPSLTTVSFPACKYIGSYAFQSCSSLATASFPSCTSIGNYAFYGCSSLTTVSFPACTSIGSNGFAYCSSLTTASFPACTSIGYAAFLFCTSLATVSFPVCTTFESQAFMRCYSLTTVSFPACKDIVSYAFALCYNLLSLYLLGSSVAKLSHSNAFSSTPIAGYTASTGGVYGSIYVPASLYATYSTSTNWAYFADRFVSVE